MLRQGDGRLNSSQPMTELCLGSEADTEWSDVTDEGHHSDNSQQSDTGTLTGSDNESSQFKKGRSSPKKKSRNHKVLKALLSSEDNLRMSMKAKHRRAHTVGHAVVISHKHPDPADLILDKIDVELFKMAKMPTYGSRKQKLSSGERERLRQQGVEFDTGDETVTGRLTLKESLAKLRGNTPTDRAGEEGDTGLGSVDDAASDQNDDDTDHITGRADVYSGGPSEFSEDDDHKTGYAEIDSDCAKQLDEKYKMIMKTKKGDSLKGLKISEQGSIKTEDFESKFQELCVPPVPRPAAKVLPTYKIHSKPRSRLSGRKEVSGAKSPVSKPPKSKSARAATRIALSTPSKKRFRGSRGAPQASDIDSVQTEDFENQFQSMMVKQVANVPITNFDQFMVDSDLDTVRSQVIREKFLSALRQAEKDNQDAGDSDASSNNDSRIDVLVEQKIQEILHKVKQNSGDFSDMDSVRAFQGSPVRHIQEESEEERTLTPVYSRSRSTKAKRSSRRSRRAAYDDDLELGEEAQQLERQSAQIRREVEAEGWRSPERHDSLSPHRARTPTMPARSGLSPNARPSSTQFSPPGHKSGQRLSQSFHCLPMHSQVESDQSLKLRDELSKIQLSIIHAKKEKQAVQGELNTISLELNEHKQEVKSTEKQIKEHRTKAENARSELMLMEFKRDSARKEMERLQNDLKKKRSELDFFGDTDETTDGNTSTDYSRLRDLKLSRVEVAKMLSEREQLQSREKSLERQIEALEKQVAANKQGVLTEQKTARQREETLKEELDAVDSQLQEVSNQKEALQKKVEKLETQLAQSEKAKISIVQEKQTECDELKTHTQEQIAQAREHHSQESSELKKQLAEVTDRLARVASEIQGKEQHNLTLREQMVALQTKLADESQQNLQLKEEKQQLAEDMQTQKEAALAEMARQYEEEKNQALDDLSHELEHSNKLVLTQAEHRFMQELTDLQSQITARELELEVVRDKLKQQEGIGKQLTDKIRTEANMRFRQLVQEERSSWESEKEQEVDRQLSSMRSEMEKTTRALREELAAERQLVDTQLKQIMDLKKEIEATKMVNRQAIREKLAAYSHVKETADYEREKQHLDKLREHFEEESHHHVERLQEAVRRLEDENARLKKENKELSVREQDISSSSDSQERAVLNEINDECRKVAALLGTTPRVVTFTSYSRSMSPGRQNNKSPIKTAIATALTNLRASNEDLRNQMKEMKQDTDQHKQIVRAVEKEKKESLDVLKQKMQKEKLAALETLKDRLIKEHLEEVDKLHKSLGKGKSMHKALREKDHELQEIQTNMKKWKNLTTEKLATQFQEEMAHQIDKRLKEYKKQQREWQRERMTQQREIERLEKEVTKNRETSALNLSTSATRTAHIYGTPVKAPPPSVDSEAAKVVKELQGRVKQLQVENSSLKLGSKLSSSTPDIHALMGSSPFSETKSNEHRARQLELQVKRLENQLKLSEDRSEKNDTLLNQKLLELTKLQSTLTQQTKELMQLERAYTQLQQKTGCTLRPSSRGLIQ